MPSIRIPDDDLPVLFALSEMPQELFDAFVSAVKSTPATLTSSKFALNVSKALPGFRVSDFYPLINALCAMYYVKERENLSTDTLAENIQNAVAEAGEEGGVKFSKEQRQLLSERLKILLSFDQNLGITAKAVDVMTEQQRVFCHARILSDIRPIFSADTKLASAAVILHNLQIGFHASGTGGHEEIYVSLDTEDIETLKQAIMRAEEKTEALKAMIVSAKVNYLEV